MQRFIENPARQTYDILVIGGGISGAAVAYEAASRGFSVALVEKGEFVAVTFAATSKLIHGGLRYLANMELGRVRESLRASWAGATPEPLVSCPPRSPLWLCRPEFQAEASN